jgi:phosphoglycolate phosphatase-like HAD superfamily hydrolase
VIVRGLALDFDGVIFDSAPESFVVARQTYAELGPAVPTATCLDALPNAFERSREEIRDLPLYRAFVNLMPLGNRAEDYAVILSILERGVAVVDQPAYDRERAGVSAGFLEAFHTRFYEVRTWFERAHPRHWRTLQGPYPELAALLRRRSGDVELAVATAKDRRSVRLMLEEHGLGDLFPDPRVLDKETGRSKAAHLKHLGEILGIPFAAITFVDDKVNHLDAVAPLGVRCVLATWGYNGPREHELAERRGYVICTLEDAERLLFDGVEP